MTRGNGGIIVAAWAELARRPVRSSRVGSAAAGQACGEAEVDWLVFDEALRVSKKESARPPRSEGTWPIGACTEPRARKASRRLTSALSLQKFCKHSAASRRYHIDCDLADACPHNLANPRTMDEYQACTRRQRNPFFTLARTLAHPQGKSRMSET